MKQPEHDWNVISIPDDFQMAYPSTGDLVTGRQTLDAIWILDRGRRTQVSMTPSVARRIANYILDATKEKP